MATVAGDPATLDDLAKVEGKAELIAGRIVTYMASGELPCFIALEIAVSLRLHARQTGVGRPYGDNLGYTLPAPLTSGRQTFSPDVSFYTGPLAANRMKFITGVPVFAVEVRSENDYKASAELAIEMTRADYFEAGTLVVWDVDPLAESVTRYRASDPDASAVFRRGEVADAEPAVPGWRLSVDDLFR